MTHGEKIRSHFLELIEYFIINSFKTELKVTYFTTNSFAIIHI
jgi:uncharacterized membrane protein